MAVRGRAEHKSHTPNLCIYWVISP